MRSPFAASCLVGPSLLGLLATQAPATLQAAIQAFESAHFDEACPLLRGFGHQAAAMAESSRGELHRYLALCAVIEEQPDAAIQNFVAALRISPELRFDARLASPKVTEALRRAREILLQQDTAPPIIEHLPQGPVTKERIDVVARVRDESRIVYVRIDHRHGGERGFLSSFMERESGDRFLGSIPANGGTSIEYAIIATDEANNTARVPPGSDVFSVMVPGAATTSDTTEWYEAWWVWTIAGAVAASGAITWAILATDTDGGLAIGNPFRAGE